MKRLLLEGKQHVQNRGSYVPSQPMDLSGMQARGQLNMKRGPLESQGDRSKQRRVLEDPDEDEVMIGDVQENEEVEHLRSEVSATEFVCWQQKEYEGILRELSITERFHEFPWSSKFGGCKQRSDQNTLGAETAR